MNRLVPWALGLAALAGIVGGCDYLSVKQETREACSDVADVINSLPYDPTYNEITSAVSDLDDIAGDGAGRITNDLADVTFAVTVGNDVLFWEAVDQIDEECGW